MRTHRVVVLSAPSRVRQDDRRAAVDGERRSHHRVALGGPRRTRDDRVGPRLLTIRSRAERQQPARTHGAVSCCLSATGVGFLDHPVPATGVRSSSRSTYRDCCPNQGGVSTFHMCKIRPGRVPPISRARRCSCDRSSALGRRLPLPSGQLLHPSVTIHLSGAHFDETSSAVHSRSPVG